MLLLGRWDGVVGGRVRPLWKLQHVGIGGTKQALIRIIACAGHMGMVLPLGGRVTALESTSAGSRRGFGLKQRRRLLTAHPLDLLDVPSDESWVLQ